MDPDRLYLVLAIAALTTLAAAAGAQDRSVREEDPSGQIAVASLEDQAIEPPPAPQRAVRQAGVQALDLQPGADAASALWTSSLASPRASAEAKTPHPPIVIVGDVGPTGFVLGYEPFTGEPIYRPGSGVTSGTGTAEDPFVIEGWATAKILLLGTTEHVRIQDNLVVPATREDPAVHLDTVDNANVTGNVLRDGGYGLWADYVEDTEVYDNDIHTHAGSGIDSIGATGLAVTNNRLEANGQHGLRLVSPDGGRVAENVARENAHTGIAVQEGQGTLVDANEATDNQENGIVVFEGSTGVEVDDNNVSDNEQAGILLEGGENNLVRANNGTASRFAVFVRDETGSQIRDNLARDNIDPEWGSIGDGIHVRACGDLLVASNTAENSELRGIRLRGSTNVTVRDNNVTDALRGISTKNTEDSDLAGNTIEGFTRPYNYDLDTVGILANGDQELGVHGNQLTDAEWGVGLNEGTGYLVSENDVRDQVEGGIQVTDLEASSRLEANYLENVTNPDDVAWDSWVVHGGIVLDGGGGVQFSANTFSGGGFRMTGSDETEFEYAIDATNTVEGDPVRYRYGVAGTTIPKPAGQVLLANVHGVRVEDVRVANTTFGIQLAFSEEVRIHNVTAEANRVGLYTVLTERTRLDNSTIRANEHEGVRLFGAKRASIEQTYIEDNGHAGVELEGGYGDHRLRDNHIAGNLWGLSAYSMSYGADAEYNWWGCPDGPDHDDCDPAFGDVDYDPWHEQPVLD